MLAADPATKDLREHIDQWLGSLSRGTAAVTELIQKEVRKAAGQLQKASAIKKTALISSVLAIPASSAGFVFPLLNAIGLSLSCIAVICERQAHVKADAVKWAGFGSAIRTDE